MHTQEHPGAGPQPFAHPTTGKQSSRRGLLAAGALAALLSTQALAFSVEAPAYAPNSGVAGGATVFLPQLKISDYAGDLDAQSIYLWDFYLSWDQNALAFDANASSIAFGAYNGALSGVTTFLGGVGSPVTNTDNFASAAGDGHYALHWESDGTTFLDLGSEITFQGAFTLKPGAAAGAYLISPEAGGIASTILDKDLNSISYGAVTAGAPMAISVVAPSAVPEPATLALLLGACIAGLGARRRHR